MTGGYTIVQFRLLYIVVFSFLKELLKAGRPDLISPCSPPHVVPDISGLQAAQSRTSSGAKQLESVFIRTFYAPYNKTFPVV